MTVMTEIGKIGKVRIGLGYGIGGDNILGIDVYIGWFDEVEVLFHFFPLWIHICSRLIIGGKGWFQGLNGLLLHGLKMLFTFGFTRGWFKGRGVRI